MKRIKTDNYASSYPIVIFIFIIALTSFLVLLLGEVLEPFFNFLNSDDDAVESHITQPREYVSSFLNIFWPKGLLLLILIGASFGLLMEMQKDKYQRGGQ